MTTPPVSAATGFPVTYENIGSQPVQIVQADSGPTVAVYNGDIQNVLLVSPTTGQIGLTNAVPVQPLTTAVIDGTKRQFAIAQSGTVASATVSPGTTQINPSPAQVAAQIALAGIPLISNDQLQNQQTLATAAPGTTQLYQGVFTGTSYEFSIDILNNGAPTVPFAKLSLIWKDKQGGVIQAQQQWILLTTNVSPASSNTLVVGRGPSCSGFLQVLLNNYDSNNVTVDFELFASARVITRHDVRSISNNSTLVMSYDPFTVLGGATYTTPVSAPGINLLGNSPGIPLASNGSAARINALYAGLGQLNVFAVMTAGGAPADITVSMYAVDPDLVSSQPIIQVYPQTPLIPLPGATSAGYLNIENITLPRAPCIALFFNGDATHTASLLYSLVSQEFSS